MASIVKVDQIQNADGTVEYLNAGSIKNASLHSSVTGGSGITALGTVASAGAITTSNPINFAGPNHTFTVKALNQPITDSQTGTTPDVANSTSDQLAIYNSSTKLWGISEAGYVVNPKLPYFKVRKSSAISGTGNVVFNTVIYNTENFYNASNGYATAPIDGLYQFFCKINAYDRIDFQFRINGGGGPESNYAEIGQYNTDNDDVGWWSNLLQSPLYLYAGDYVQVNVYTLTQNTDAGIWTHFSGYLLG